MSDSTSTGGGAGAPPPYYPQQPQPAPQKRGLGCFLWGCLAVIVLGVAAFAAMGGLFYYGLTQIRDKYTDTQPMVLPQLQLNEEERHAVKTRFDEFRAAVDRGSAAEPLSLNEDEINALIAEGDPNDPFRDAIRVEIEDDRIVGQISLPMDRIGLPLFGGRYLNATADMTASVKNGELDVRIESATVKGDALPSQFISELRRENLAAEFSKKPEARRTLQNLESLDIRDGSLILVPKAGGSVSLTPPDPGDGGGGS